MQELISVDLKAARIHTSAANVHEILRVTANLAQSSTSPTWGTRHALQTLYFPKLDENDELVAILMNAFLHAASPFSSFSPPISFAPKISSL